MDKELEQFQADLLQSVRQMKTGTAVKITKVEIPAAAEARAKVGMSQNDFAALMGVSKRTLQEWEQGRREPSGAAKTLLKIAARHPETLRELNVMSGQ
jgi:putative transcriptional regulator